MKFSKLTQCVFVSLALALSSCASPERRAPEKADYQLDASTPRGGIIYGFAIERPLQSATHYSLVWTCYDPATRAICPERDPNSERNLFGVPQRLNWWGNSINVGLFESQEPLKQMRYVVRIMPPGHYILDQFTTNDLSPNPTPTNIYARGRTLVSPFIDRKKTTADTNAPRFTLERGQLLYLGDFAIDASQLPIGVRLTHNETAARAALAEYPNIKVEMNVTPLRTGD